MIRDTSKTRRSSANDSAPNTGMGSCLLSAALLTGAALAATVWTSAAWGQPGPRGGQAPDRTPGNAIVRAADADLDNTISAEEWQGFLAALDASESGEIEPAALHQQIKRHGLIARLGHSLDVDDDSLVTLSDMEELFVRLDRNEDGQLSPDDRRAGSEGDGEARRPRRGRRGGPQGAILLAGLADSDQDGAVSAAEWRTLADSLEVNTGGGYDLGQLADRLIAEHDTAQRGEGRGRDRLDSDGDGILEIADLQAIHDQLDSDGDGILTAEELPSRRGPRHGPRGGQRGGRRGFGG